MKIKRADSASSSSGGISAAGLLGVVFITLKLTGVIDWSWVWVLAPFWIGVALLVLILAIMGAIAGVLMWRR